mgnify:CR=1 FL=1
MGKTLPKRAKLFDLLAEAEAARKEASDMQAQAENALKAAQSASRMADHELSHAREERARCEAVLAAQRERREAELRSQAGRTVALFDRMVEGIIVLGPDGRIRLSNRAAAAFSSTATGARVRPMTTITGPVTTGGKTWRTRSEPMRRTRRAKRT